MQLVLLHGQGHLQARSLEGNLPGTSRMHAAGVDKAALLCTVAGNGRNTATWKCVHLLSASSVGELCAAGPQRSMRALQHGLWGGRCGEFAAVAPGLLPPPPLGGCAASGEGGAAATAAGPLALPRLDWAGHCRGRARHALGVECLRFSGSGSRVCFSLNHGVASMAGCVALLAPARKADR